MKPANDTKAATVSRLRCQQRGTCAAAAHAVHARGKLQGELPGHCATGVRMRCRQSLGRGGGRRTDQVMQKPQSTGSARAAQRAVNEVDAHVTTRRRRRTSSSRARPYTLSLASAHAALAHRHVQKGWRGGGVQRDGARAVCMWAETTRLLEVMIT